MLYNTAFFWRADPSSLRQRPVSVVIEMAGEAIRINREMERRQNGRR